MLVALSIRDVVLIERLDLQFGNGLCALTGETGAGKSILLDALGLALGRRAEAALVRQGAERASVTAAFEPPAAHAAWTLLTEQGLDREETIFLRRVLGSDGRSRAFVNDQQVSIGFLRALGDTLVEIHGQNDRLGLLDPGTHRAALDAFGAHGELLAATRVSHAAWREAAAALEARAEAAATARRDEAYLRHVLGELDALEPEPGEESRLAAERTYLMHGERLSEALGSAERELVGQGSVETRLRSAQREIERVDEQAGHRLRPVAEALERAAIETTEAMELLAAALRDIEREPNKLEAVEQRLFALRGAARKHSVPVDALAALRASFAERLASIDDEGGALVALERAAEAAKVRYRADAEELSAARSRAATALAEAVTGELAPLKMGDATFQAELTPLEESGWSADGGERVTFTVATNPGSAPGPLHRIASGGELSRFMLALEVVLARTVAAPSLIFDEIDAGIGGAVADAVGQRLVRLASEAQVLVVTHQPQVAARAAHHFRVSKMSNGGGTRTTVEVLPLDDRREEIARMLAGAEVTDAARAAADSLMQGGTP